MMTPTSLILLSSKVVSPCMFSLGPVRNLYENDPYSSIFHSQCRDGLSRSNQQYARFSLSTTNNKDGSNINPLGVEIISVQNIKPSFPTPQHLKTYKVSMLDQHLPNFYVSFVYMYSNEDQNGISDLDLNSKRGQLLKQSLSQTLTRFYPLAGKVKGDSIIDCDDDGVYYVEAQVNESLTNFVNQSNKYMHQLLPFLPASLELFSKTYVVMIQTTTFSCGGISIGIYTSHKIIDGTSHVTFLNAWASTSRGSSQEICPSFISPSIFLPSSTLDLKGFSKALNFFPKQGKVVTKRFVFSASSLMTLKEKARAPSRALGVTGLIWKCIMEASRVRTSSSHSDSVLVFPMNLRSRSSPPFPPHSIGNIIWPTYTRCKSDNGTELSSVVGVIKNTVDKVNNTDFTEKLKGEQGSSTMVEYVNEMKLICSGEKVEHVGVTSLCNSGIYEAANFGWGKPSFISVGDSNADIALLPSFVYLMDTRSGNGIEAWVSLVEQDMVVFERNEELLAFAFEGSLSSSN